MSEPTGAPCQLRRAVARGPKMETVNDLAPLGPSILMGIVTTPGR